MTVNRAIDKQVLLDFFLTFARCEYALKTGGFAKCGGARDNDAKEAQADWDTFAQHLQNFGASMKPNERAACERLTNAPLWELVIVHGQVMWQQRSQPAVVDLVQNSLTAVRRLRNNLFHGNEASAVHGYVASDVEQLLRDAVLVLQAVVAEQASVQAAYEGAAP